MLQEHLSQTGLASAGAVNFGQSFFGKKYRKKFIMLLRRCIVHTAQTDGDYTVPRSIYKFL